MIDTMTISCFEAQDTCFTLTSGSFWAMHRCLAASKGTEVVVVVISVVVAEEKRRFLVHKLMSQTLPFFLLFFAL